MSWEHEFAKKCIHSIHFTFTRNLFNLKTSESLSFHVNLLSLNGKKLIQTHQKRAQKFIYYFTQIYFLKFDFLISLPHPDVYAMPRINMGLNTNSLEQDVLSKK